MINDKRSSMSGTGPSFAVSHREFVLNCGVQGCCPTVKIYKSKVTISDDFGGKVSLTKAQFGDLSRVLGEVASAN